MKGFAAPKLVVLMGVVSASLWGMAATPARAGEWKVTYELAGTDTSAYRHPDPEQNWDAEDAWPLLIDPQTNDNLEPDNPVHRGGSYTEESASPWASWLSSGGGTTSSSGAVTVVFTWQPEDETDLPPTKLFARLKARALVSGGGPHGQDDTTDFQVKVKTGKVEAPTTGDIWQYPEYGDGHWLRAEINRLFQIDNSQRASILRLPDVSLLAKGTAPQNPLVGRNIWTHTTAQAVPDTRGLKFSRKDVRMCMIGASTAVGVTTLPPEAAATLTFQSDNPNVATVSGSAPTITITGLYPGQTTITATDADGLVWGELPVFIGEGWLHNYLPPVEVTLVSPSAAAVAALGDDYGLVYLESVDVDITACLGSDQRWHAVLTGVNGDYSKQTRLLPGQQEVTGPSGNTTQDNFCDQVESLRGETYNSGRTSSENWFMLQAVEDHEAVHESHAQPTLEVAMDGRQGAIEALFVEDEPGMTMDEAVEAIKALPEFQEEEDFILGQWWNEFGDQGRRDHAQGGPCEQAEHAIVDPMVNSICSHANQEGWPNCGACTD